MVNIDRFYDRELGWHFHIGPRGSFRTWLAIWWTKGCDCGAAIGNREIRFPLS